MENRKKIDDMELQVVLDGDNSQTQKLLDEQLDVGQQAVSNRPREIGKIQKIDRWVPPELNDREMEKRKNTRDILPLGTKESRFCIL